MSGQLDPQRVIMWLGIELAEKKAEIGRLRDEIAAARATIAQLSNPPAELGDLVEEEHEH